MAIPDLLSDFYASLSFTEVHAEAPPPEEQEEEEEEKADGGEKDEGADGEGGGDDDEEDEQGEEEEEEEEEEPEDLKPKLEAGMSGFFLLHLLPLIESLQRLFYYPSSSTQDH